MTFKFGQSSEKNLIGAHPELVALCRRTLYLSDIDFGILDGLRTVSEEVIFVKNGKSQTMKSRHLTGHAIDFGVYVDGQYINGDTEKEYGLYKIVGGYFKHTASSLLIPIVWGGDWKTLKDGGHIELNRHEYPA